MYQTKVKCMYHTINTTRALKCKPLVQQIHIFTEYDSHWECVDVCVCVCVLYVCAFF